MAVTTSVSDVRLIFHTSLSDDELRAFLEAAKDLVDETLGSTSLTDSRLNRIAAFLTAHLAHVLSPSVSRERVGDYDFSVQGETGEGLKATFYGQMVLLLDPTGKMAGLGNKLVHIALIEEPDE